ncbi:Hypothetical protein KVN_LOCUS364 [uncultured virus]|nr:Hypothetical protein KVN_LOCUS364 [uncultured virus]
MLEDKNLDNCKRILCYNIINNKICTYSTKCMYAHSLSEQKIDSIRHKVYTLLKNNSSLTDLDLINDNKLYRTLLELTKLCSMCIKKMCPGGYNCRNGAININFRVCYEDLMFGNCKKINCTSLHLTTRGLISYNFQKDIKYKNLDKFENKDEDIFIKNTDNYFNTSSSKYQNIQTDNNCYKKKYGRTKNILTDIPGILLTEKFLMTHFNGKEHDLLISSESESDSKIEEIINYLNESLSEDSINESIFKD